MATTLNALYTAAKTITPFIPEGHGTAHHGLSDIHRDTAFITWVNPEASHTQPKDEEGHTVHVMNPIMPNTVAHDTNGATARFAATDSTGIDGVMRILTGRLSSWAQTVRDTACAPALGIYRDSIPHRPGWKRNIP